MMRGHLRRLTRQTFGYGIGMAVSRFAGVILVPIYTRVLSPAEYGTWGVINTVSTILSLLVFFGLDAAMARFYFETDDPAQRRLLVGTAFWTVMTWTLVLIGVALLATPMIAAGMLGQRAYEPFLRLALLTIPFSVMQWMQLFLLRIRFALLRYNALALGNLVLGAGLSVLFVAGFGYGLRGIFLGILIGYACTSLLGWWINRGMIGRWSRPLLGPMLTMGLPLVPAGLGYWVLNYVDRWFLTRAVSATELGLYELANKVTSGITLFTSTFQYAWGPFSYSIERREGALRTYAKALNYYAFFMLGGALALGLFAREILVFFTPPAFHAAYLAVAPLTYAPVAYGAFTLLSTGATLAKKTAPVAAMTLVAGASNVLLNLLLITWLGWGIIGAACATGLSFLLSAALVYRSAQRIYPIPYQIGSVLRALAAQAALMALIPLVLVLDYWAGLVLRMVALASYPLVLWGLGCFEDWEVRLIGQTLRQPRRLIGWIGRRTP